MLRGTAVYNGRADSVSKTNLYTEIIEVFNTKNRLYIDIRSEKGYSYNFYQNYDDPSNPGKNIQIKDKAASNFTIDPYNKFFDWPIYYTELSTSSGQFEIRLRTDENTSPLLYIQNAKAFKRKKNPRSFLRKAELIPLSNTGWTKSIKLKSYQGGSHFSANYLQLYYFRQDSPSAGNTTTPKIEDDSDTFFGDIRLVPLGISLPTLSVGRSPRLQLIKDNKFSYVAYPELYRDTQSVIFITRLQSLQHSNKRTSRK